MKGKETSLYAPMMGVARAVKAQVADVNKDLLSVSKLVKAGSAVVFHPEGSYIQDLETQEKMWLK